MATEQQLGLSLSMMKSFQEWFARSRPIARGRPTNAFLLQRVIDDMLKNKFPTAQILQRIYEVKEKNFDGASFDDEYRLVPEHQVSYYTCTHFKILQFLRMQMSSNPFEQQER